MVGSRTGAGPTGVCGSSIGGGTPTGLPGVGGSGGMGVGASGPVAADRDRDGNAPCGSAPVIAAMPALDQVEETASEWDTAMR